MVDEIIDLDIFGNVIGSGGFSTIIEPYNEWDYSDIDSPVLIITKDKFKKQLMKNMFKNNEDVQVQDLFIEENPAEGCEDLSEEETYIVWTQFNEELLIQRDLEEKGYTMFYMTKLSPFKIGFNSSTSAGMENFMAKFEEAIEDDTSSLEECLSKLKVSLDEADALLVDKNAKVTADLSKEVYSAISHALMATQEIEREVDMYADFHNGQFVMHEPTQKIYCIDPVLCHY